MNKLQFFSLEEFAKVYLERAGAVVEKTGHALMEILLPDELVPYFNVNHLSLSFDYEVAAENPGSIFAAYGSQFLDTLIKLALQYGQYTKFYWPGSIPVPQRNLEKYMLEEIQFAYCRPARLDMQWPTEHAFYAFFFRITYRSFEKTEEITPVVLDGYNGLIQPDFLELWENIVSKESPDYTLPRSETLLLDTLYQSACREIEIKVREQAIKLRRSTNAAKNRELAKIARYYEETAKEIEQKISSADEEKRVRLEKQLAAVITDSERRQKDAAKRYDVEAEVRLEHVVVYYMPCLHIKLEIQHKNRIFYQTVIYNPLTTQIQAIICPLCGKPVFRLTPNDQGQLICLEHLDK